MLCIELYKTFIEFILLFLYHTLPISKVMELSTQIIILLLFFLLLVAISYLKGKLANVKSTKD